MTDGQLGMLALGLALLVLWFGARAIEWWGDRRAAQRCQCARLPRKALERGIHCEDCHRRGRCACRA